jgi:predicted DNA-binding transcriptional regulator AlpA
MGSTAKVSRSPNEPLPPAVLLTATELCQLLRCSQSSLDRRQAAGTLLAPVRTGTGRNSHRRWLRAEVLAWIDAGQPRPDQWRWQWERIKPCIG